MAGIATLDDVPEAPVPPAPNRRKRRPRHVLIGVLVLVAGLYGVGHLVTANDLSSTGGMSTEVPVPPGSVIGAVLVYAQSDASVMLEKATIAASPRGVEILAVDIHRAQPHGTQRADLFGPCDPLLLDNSRAAGTPLAGAKLSAGEQVYVSVWFRMPAETFRAAGAEVTYRRGPFRHTQTLSNVALQLTPDETAEPLFDEACVPRNGSRQS